MKKIGKIIRAVLEKSQKNSTQTEDRKDAWTVGKKNVRNDKRGSICRDQLPKVLCSKMCIIFSLKNVKHKIQTQNGDKKRNLMHRLNKASIRWTPGNQVYLSKNKKDFGQK